jgi:propanol-preferring alcohol dehydrogenase
MRAAVVEKFGAPLVIKNVPVPTPGRDEVLIKVRRVTCCVVCRVSCRVLC